MLIHAANDPRAPPTRDLRVRIPFRLYVALMSAKVLTGRSMGDIVTDALEAHLRTRGRNGP